jgi:hypothetical protein
MKWYQKHNSNFLVACLSTYALFLESEEVNITFSATPLGGSVIEVHSITLTWYVVSWSAIGLGQHLQTPIMTAWPPCKVGYWIKKYHTENNALSMGVVVLLFSICCDYVQLLHGSTVTKEIWRITFKCISIVSQCKLLHFHFIDKWLESMQWCWWWVLHVAKLIGSSNTRECCCLTRCVNHQKPYPKVIKGCSY